MPEAIRLVEELCIQKRINHAGHKVLAYQMFCVQLVIDDAGNPKFSKKKSTAHIDAPVSMAMALYWANKIKPFKSKYEDEDLTTI